LSFSNHELASSKIKIDPSNYRNNSHLMLYAVEIEYLCQDFGGALIDYNLLVKIPDCGETRVYWKKLCGDPICIFLFYYLL